MYTTYEFYKNDFGGRTIQEDQFAHLARIGELALEYRTRGRAAQSVADGKYEDLIKGCVCELAELRLQVEEQGEQKEASESVGGYSVTYKNDSADEVSKKTQNIICMYLANTGLLYGGVEVV